MPKTAVLRSVLFRYQHKNVSLPCDIYLPKNKCFLAIRRFEIDDRNVHKELTFDRPLIGSK